MKPLLKFTAVIVLWAGIIISCKKNDSCDGCINGNNPPIANAGNDEVITLPVNSILLNGSASRDPDGTITRWLWTKVAGPDSFAIINAFAVKTMVTNLKAGTYQFELKVTDNGGLSATDRVSIKVDSVNPSCGKANRPYVAARLVPIGTLSVARQSISVATAGSKILFAGGIVLGTSPSASRYTSRVDIYDMNTQKWSIAELSEPRYGMATAVNGNKIFFAGGENGDGTGCVNVVDIYDVATNNWSVAALSEGRNDLAAASVGNKVLFAGGCGYSYKVDIYEIAANKWSVALMSEGKTNITAVTVKNKVYFAGGQTYMKVPDSYGRLYIPSNRIDIYDNATNSWSTSSLTERKAIFAGVSVADKIYWAGGITGEVNKQYYTSCVVEIQDVNTGNSSIAHLFRPAIWWINAGQNAVVENNKIVFPFEDDNQFNIYDIATNTWSIGLLDDNIKGASIISANNTIYIAGGQLDGILYAGVWRLEF